MFVVVNSIFFFLAFSLSHRNVIEYMEFSFNSLRPFPKKMVRDQNQYTHIKENIKFNSVSTALKWPHNDRVKFNTTTWEICFWFIALFLSIHNKTFWITSIHIFFVRFTLFTNAINSGQRDESEKKAKQKTVFMCSKVKKKECNKKKGATTKKQNYDAGQKWTTFVWCQHFIIFLFDFAWKIWPNELRLLPRKGIPESLSKEFQFFFRCWWYFSFLFGLFSKIHGIGKLLYAIR